MTAYEPQPSQLHSPAWVAITKIQFGISVLALVIGLAYLPVEPWIVAYLVMGTLLLLWQPDGPTGATSSSDVATIAHE